MALTLKIRGRKHMVADFAEAHAVYDKAWTAELNRGGCIRGASIFDGDKLVARVSQNGRIWPPEDYTPGMKPLYEPR
jgi:hypothetical protein